MLLSIILPVYNVEAYLGKCINSCLCQDLSKNNYEIIVVIDGSPDNSIEVARQFQSDNDNVKIVVRENGGLSAARNTGLEAASGDYVWFIDSDDYIEENILGDIVRNLQSNQLDALWVGWQDVDEKGMLIPPFAPHYHSADKSIMSGCEFMTRVLNNYLYAWSFIYRRSFLVTYQLRFTEGMYYEDTDFAFRSLPLVGKIRLYDKTCYNYLQRDGSIVHFTNKRKLEDICKNCVSATSFLKTSDDSLKRFYQMCFTSYYMLFVKEVLKAKNKEFEAYLITQTKQNGFGNVSMFGNITTKIIGLLYNLLGVRLSLCILSKIVR